MSEEFNSESTWGDRISKKEKIWNRSLVSSEGPKLEEWDSGRRGSGKKVTADWRKGKGAE